MCVCVCLCAGVIEMLVAPSDQTVNKGDGIFLPCVVLSQHTDGVTTVTWKRNRKQDGENSAEELKNTTKKVTVFQSEEQKGKGHTLIRSILYLGCVSEEDVGTYSCHVANNDATKTTSFMIDITGPGRDSNDCSIYMCVYVIIQYCTSLTFSLSLSQSLVCCPQQDYHLQVDLVSH